MSESVPVRRVLRCQCDDIIADDIGCTRVFLGERIVVIESAFLVARQRGQSEAGVSAGGQPCRQEELEASSGRTLVPLGHNRPLACGFQV